MPNRDDIADGDRYAVVWRCGAGDDCVQPHIYDKTAGERQTDGFVWAGDYQDGKADANAVRKADNDLNAEIASRTGETITRIDDDPETRIVP
jgi:hypothetical protein